MTDPLAPQPMSPEQIVDLVERVRAVTPGYATRLAAKYAHDTPSPVAAAARMFGVTPEAARFMFCKLFPGVPRLLRDRARRVP